MVFFFFFQAEDGIRDGHVTGVQTCALPIFQFLAGEELEQQEGRRVRRVEVVENEDERLRERGGAEERGCRLEESEARSFRVAHGRLRKLTVELVQLGKDLREVGRASAELAAERLWIGASRVRTKRLNPGPVGGGATRLPAASHEHFRPPLPRPPCELLDEAALADSRLPADQDEAALAGERVVESTAELAQLTRTADESTWTSGAGAL